MHTHRVAELAGALARKVGIDAALSQRIARAARLHDIGKVAIPPSILSKREALDDAEADIMRSHTTAGAELLASADVDDADTVIAVVLHHHEWWSGGGYPDGLSGEEIPLAARITAIAEAFDAMTHERPYRPPLSLHNALAIIAERGGRQFDPRLATEFVGLVHELAPSQERLDALLQQNCQRSTFVRAQKRLKEQIRSEELSGSRFH
jgi:putative two-component system response regulator